MMVSDDRKHKTERCEWRADSLPQYGMLLDQCPFLRGQSSWLQKNRIRHGNLSHVVYNSSAAECDQLLFGKLEMLAQPSRILCQAFTMTMRVRIFAFNAPRQREQD